MPLTDRGLAPTSRQVTDTAARSAQDWQIFPPPLRLIGNQRGTVETGNKYHHEVLVAMAARGPGAARSEWIEFAGSSLEHTLRCLLGPAAPLTRLIDAGLSEAALSWPPSGGDAPLGMWLQRIAAGVAREHLMATPRGSNADAPARPGSARQLLTTVYATLGASKPDGQLAFVQPANDGRAPSSSAASLAPEGPPANDSSRSSFPPVPAPKTHQTPREAARRLEREYGELATGRP